MPVLILRKIHLSLDISFINQSEVENMPFLLTPEYKNRSIKVGFNTYVESYKSLNTIEKNEWQHKKRGLVIKLFMYMKKKISIFLYLTLICSCAHSQNTKYLWTFDCNQQLWGVFEHSMSFNVSFKLPNQTLNSSHLEFRHRAGQTSNWLFGTTDSPINADENKFLHFSLTLSNAGQIPTGGIPALFVWTAPGDWSKLYTKPFQIFSGQKDYMIDLSNHADWKGIVTINRFHFPSNDQTANGYTPETAVYSLDWFAAASDAMYRTPTQDTSAACKQELAILTNPESVVFGNRVSMKIGINGILATLKMKLWDVGGDTLVSERLNSDGTELYFSFCDLKTGTDYEWKLQASNKAGTVNSDVKSFTTENKPAEDMPMKYWMTPSPFDLMENVNDHLYGLDNWKEAAAMAHVYKIHGATYYGTDQFDTLNFPKLIYAANKHRLRLALEAVVGGNNSGQTYANVILSRVKEIENLGGKIEFFTWDGMMFRNFYDTNKSTKFRSVEEGLEAVAEATRIIKEQYPGFEIIPLPNLPNWDIKDANGQIIVHNAGDWAGKTGVPSWDYLSDIYLGKIAEKGIKINFIEIDHPFNYYQIGRANSAKRILAIDDYCRKNNLELIHIINTAVGEMPIDVTDAKFKSDCLQYLKDLKLDGISPEYIDLESWYPYPQYLTPETKENSFTNVLRDLGRDFIKNPTGVSWFRKSEASNMNSIQVYQNPATNLLTVNSQQTKVDVTTICDSVGRTVYVNNESFIGVKTFNLALKRGIYLIKLKGKAQFYTYKIIII